MPAHSHPMVSKSDVASLNATYAPWRIEKAGSSRVHVLTDKRVTYSITQARNTATGEIIYQCEGWSKASRGLALNAILERVDSVRAKCQPVAMPKEPVQDAPVAITELDRCDILSAMDHTVVCEHFANGSEPALLADQIDAVYSFAVDVARDCVWADFGAPDDCSPSDIVRNMARHYDGGMSAMVADALADMPTAPCALTVDTVQDHTHEQLRAAFSGACVAYVESGNREQAQELEPVARFVIERAYAYPSFVLNPAYNVIDIARGTYAAPVEPCRARGGTCDCVAICALESSEAAPANRFDGTEPESSIPDDDFPAYAQAVADHVAQDAPVAPRYTIERRHSGTEDGYLWDVIDARTGATVADCGGWAYREAAEECMRRLTAPVESFAVEELELGVRAYNIVKRAGVNTFGDLAAVTCADALAWSQAGRPLGTQAVQEIIDAQESIAAQTFHGYCAACAQGECDYCSSGCQCCRATVTVRPMPAPFAPLGVCRYLDSRKPAPCDVIGAIDKSMTGNVILRIGRLSPGIGWEQSAHVILSPADARTLRRAIGSALDLPDC